MHNSSKSKQHNYETDICYLLGQEKSIRLFLEVPVEICSRFTWNTLSCLCYKQQRSPSVTGKLSLFITFLFFQLVLLRILLRTLALRGGKVYLFTKSSCLFYLPLHCNCKYSFPLPELDITHKGNYYSHTILCRVNDYILAQSRYSWVLLNVSRHWNLTGMERIADCQYHRIPILLCLPKASGVL